jgi:hypothetical protein
LVNAPGAGKMERQSSLPASGRGRRVGLIVLWGLAVLIFGVGDILTTAANIGLGGTEGHAWIVPAVLTCAGTYLLLYNVASLALFF